MGVDEADFVYEYIIEPAIKDVLGDNCSDRELDNLAPGAITEKIIQKINTYDYSIVDITGGNPNVFYELGVRHALRKKTTIIMAKVNTIIPFDIGNYRVLEYNPFKFEISRETLTRTLREAEADKFRNDSLVSEVLGDYEIVFKNSHNEDMPLEYFMERIKKISVILKDKAMLKTSTNKNAKAFGYAPDAIIGISNGGMIFADILHRLNIYKQHKCAFFALWANRDHPGKYFQSNANAYMLKGFIEDVKRPPEEVRILLVDDNVSGGDTSKQAISFIREKTPGVHVRFLPLFFNREEIIERIEKDILWTHRAFNITREEILGFHFVNYQRFPYEKPISGH